MVVITEQDANGNTVYKLVAKPENPEQIYVASITANGQTAYFDTLAAAVKTVQSGQTITLLKNSDAAETITISRAVTFTLDLKTFTMKDTIAAGSGFVLTRGCCGSQRCSGRCAVVPAGKRWGSHSSA